MEKGLVTKSTGSWYIVKKGPDVIHCRIRGNLRIKGTNSTNPVAVGDQAMFSMEKKEKTGVIHQVLERKNYIIRKSSNLSRQNHIIASNLDQAFLIITPFFPRVPNEFTDRYLVTAEAYHIPVCLIFNKTDLIIDDLKEELDDKIQIYRSIQYPCYEISVKTGKNIDVLRALMHNKITLISGYSGVGKSSLINKLIPGLNLKTGDISTYHLQGKHTTAFAEMFELPSGGSVIDTPGIRGFGIVELEKNELGHYFPEIFSISKNCQYYNCTHTHEPGCAVKNATEEGGISPSRYRSYLNIYFDNDSKYR